MSVAFVMELTLVPLFLPEIKTTFDLSVNELAWFFNSYGIAVAVGVLLGGWLGDKFNTKNVFALGVLFFALGSALVAWAENYQIITIARALQGFGGGVFSPLVPILLASASPERPGKILILWGSATGYVAALGPILYSGLFAEFGWSLAFAIFALTAIAALIIVLRSDIPDDARKISGAKTDQTRIYRSRNLWLMFGYVFCTYGSISFYLFSIPIRLAEDGFQVVSLGLMLSIMWMSFAVVSTLMRNIVDKPYVRGVLLAAPVFIAASFGLAYYTDNHVLFALSSLLMGTGLACSNAPSTLLVLKFAPKGTSALSASFDICFARIGGVITIFALAQSVYEFAFAGIILLSIAAVLFVYAATKMLYDQDMPRTAHVGR